MAPLGGIAQLSGSTTPLAVNHQGQFPAVTMSFNLAPGVSLGGAVELINRAERDIHMPSGIRGTFAGTAQAFQASLANQHAAVSGNRRAACPGDLRHRPQRHRDGWNYSADWYRQEKCDSDDRFCA
jgi:hypothetical protein